MVCDKFQDKRIQVYLGDRISQSDHKPIPHRIDKVLQLNSFDSKSIAMDILKKIYPTSGCEARYEKYIREAQVLFSMCEQDGYFNILAEDARDEFDVPVIVKSRLIKDNKNGGVILPLNRARHWAGLDDIFYDDRPFESKKNKLVWRGATTGRFGGATIASPYSSRYYVSRVPRDHPGIDVRFSDIVQTPFSETTNELFSRNGAWDISIKDVTSALGDKMNKKDILSNKFLLSLEGNDVASGLKWMCASNSTVIMPVPICESWFCESQLTAWEHYVPVNHDLSNIEEVYDWCLSNLDFCKAIALNAREYVKKFLNIDIEIEMLRSVTKSYRDSVKGMSKMPSIDDIFDHYQFPDKRIQEIHQFKSSTERWLNGVSLYEKH